MEKDRINFYYNTTVSCIICGLTYKHKNKYNCCFDCWRDLSNNDKETLIEDEDKSQVVTYRIPVYSFKRAVLGGFVGSSLFWLLVYCFKFLHH